MPNLFETHRLGELDRLGSDAIDFGDGEKIHLIVQCKGFELPVFGESQLKQCQAEVAKFKRLNMKTDAYWLVINRHVISTEDRAAIMSALSDLVTSGQVAEALLLDPALLIAKLRDTALVQIGHWTTDSLNQAASDRRKYLQVVNYIEPVPFVIDGRLRDNPSSYFAEYLEHERSKRAKNQFGKDRRPPRVLLTGSFGFGKTSTLLETSRLLIESGLHAIYIPATALSARAFSSGHGLISDILTAVLPYEKELSQLAMQVAVDALRDRLQSSDDWILLLDALDESPFSDNQQKIHGLLGGMIDAGLTARSSSSAVGVSSTTSASVIAASSAERIRTGSHSTMSTCFPSGCSGDTICSLERSHCPMAGPHVTTATPFHAARNATRLWGKWSRSGSAKSSTVGRTRSKISSRTAEASNCLCGSDSFI